MNSVINYFCSTIGRKQMMAVAGIGLCLFVLGHVAGNLLMFVSPDAYNMYGHKLVSNPIIYVIEAGLIGIFVLHVIMGLSVTIRNRAARGQQYAVSAKNEKKTTLTTKTMWWQGVVILIFVIFHLITFKFGEAQFTTIDGVNVRDLFSLVVQAFKQPLYVIWYIFAISVLMFHLTHGFYSSLQTLGLHHPAYSPTLKCISIFYGVAVGLGFIAQPIYVYLNY